MPLFYKSWRSRSRSPSLPAVTSSMSSPESSFNQTDKSKYLQVPFFKKWRSKSLDISDRPLLRKPFVSGPSTASEDEPEPDVEDPSSTDNFSCVHCKFLAQIKQRKAASFLKIIVSPDYDNFLKNERALSSLSSSSSSSSSSLSAIEQSSLSGCAYSPREDASHTANSCLSEQESSFGLLSLQDSFEEDTSGRSACSFNESVDRSHSVAVVDFRGYSTDASSVYLSSAASSFDDDNIQLSEDPRTRTPYRENSPIDLTTAPDTMTNKVCVGGGMNEETPHTFQLVRAIYSKTNKNNDADAETSSTKSVEDNSYIDWTEYAVQGSHMWVDYPSGESCYLTEKDCVFNHRHNSRRRCSACHMTGHTACVLQMEREAQCKPTFREAGVRNYREQQAVLHHWIHKKRQEGRCKACFKSFAQKNFFQSNKDMVALCCSWCQVAYHHKAPCFQMDQLEAQCDFGEFYNVIIPPSWIIKISRKLAYKSSIKKMTKKASKRRMTLKRSNEKFDSADFKPFIIKPIPDSKKKPLLVFVNPRSGGNQGTRLLQKFYFYLNPRQVFDLCDGGPNKGLELFKKVPNLHILVCGGDGTVGWVLSEIDKVEFSSPPAVAVLPLGTGNDLARTLNWGSGYADEPVSKILQQVEESQLVLLDRWDIETQTSNLAYTTSNEDKEASSRLPISVMNNYFSLGADAHVLMEFHESREANPEKFNSRLRNKIFFAGAGSKDLLKRTWRDLVDHVTIECDGVDITQRIKELKLHCLLFLNIPKYSSGTNPWGGSSGVFGIPQNDDGLLEVIGLTTAQLATLQVGGHGEKIAQCNEVKLTTYKTIPMQVDGEPCRLLPSVITIKLRNRARMLMKQKKVTNTQTSLKDASLTSNHIRLQVSRIGLSDYETYHYDKEKLKEISVPLGIIIIPRDADLENVREHINRLGKEMCTLPGDKDNTYEADTLSTLPSVRPLSPQWCFLDSTTAVRFFRVDRGQEHLHYITDISSEDLYILDPEFPSSASFDEDKSPGVHRPFNSRSSVVTEYKYPVTPPRSPLLEEYDGKLSLADKALIDSAKRGDLKRFNAAYQRGANMLQTDSDGMTVLHNAARFNYKDIVQFIILHGPSEVLDKLDREKGQTALHKAAWYQRRTICRMLVQAGSDLLIKDKQGNTPRNQAIRAEDLELANFLEYQEMLQQTQGSSTQV